MRPARRGQEAIDYWARLKTKRATQIKTALTILAIVLIYVVLDHYFIVEA